MKPTRKNTKRAPSVYDGRKPLISEVLGEVADDIECQSRYCDDLSICEGLDAAVETVRRYIKREKAARR